jgi:hypothetical protein
VIWQCPPVHVAFPAAQSIAGQATFDVHVARKVASSVSYRALSFVAIAPVSQVLQQALVPKGTATQSVSTVQSFA